MSRKLDHFKDYLSTNLKKTIITILISFICFTVFTQNNVLNELKTLHENKAYDTIISEYAPHVANYSAKAIFYVGVAYYMKFNYSKATEILNLSLKKDKTNPETYYYKANMSNYNGRFVEANKFYKKAIKLNPNKSEYLCGLADNEFITGNASQALKLYKSATKLNDSSDYPFLKIPEIHVFKKEYAKALKALYIAKNRFSKENKSYSTTVSQIAKLELLKQNYNKAIEAFEELIKIYPEKKYNYFKLMQVYYYNKENEKAELYKPKLFEILAKNFQDEYQRKWFNFDRFFWEGYQVFGLEKFEFINNKLHYQHKFYVTNFNGKVIITILTKNSPVAPELSGSKLHLEMEKNGSYSTMESEFKENFNYLELKKKAVHFLNKRNSKLKKIKSPLYRVKRK